MCFFGDHDHYAVIGYFIKLYYFSPCPCTWIDTNLRPLAVIEAGSHKASTRKAKAKENDGLDQQLDQVESLTSLFQLACTQRFYVIWFLTLIWSGNVMKQFLMLFRPMLAVELSAFNFGHIILAGQVLDFIYS